MTESRRRDLFPRAACCRKRKTLCGCLLLIFQKSQVATLATKEKFAAEGFCEQKAQAAFCKMNFRRHERRITKPPRSSATTCKHKMKNHHPHFPSCQAPNTKSSFHPHESRCQDLKSIFPIFNAHFSKFASRASDDFHSNYRNGSRRPAAQIQNLLPALLMIPIQTNAGQALPLTREIMRGQAYSTA